ncbi:MAG TPA: hypothetical protein DCG75_19655 [Bacteroidales bacterium]|nr:hypothetical protein [Bacteroidales bacterium]
MKILKSLLVLSLIFFTTEVFGQELPDTYQAIFNEMVINFETIRSGNSIKEGKNTLSVFSQDRIVLRLEHKKQVKNLTFIKKANEEKELRWVAANQITIDMVNKYEDDLTETLKEMLELTQKRSKE